MSSVSNCPHCGRQVQIPVQMQGRLVRCPLCGQVFIAGGNPQAVAVGSVHPIEPHRGGTILVLGILSLVICQLLGPIAWIMGSIDLAKMRRGEMDNSGYGITQAGYTLGIVGTVLMIVGCVFAVLWGIFEAAFAGRLH